MTTDPKKNLNSYARYSGMAFQMLVIILLSVFGGLKLDQYLHTRPVFTIILTVAGVIVSIYYALKDLLKK